jgi:hypothetical protein
MEQKIHISFSLRSCSHINDIINQYNYVCTFLNEFEDKE